MDQKTLCRIAAVCGALVFLGCLMPWAKFPIPDEAAAMARAFGADVKTSISGTDGHWTAGVLVLILGLVGGAAAALTGFGFVKSVPIPQKNQWLIAGGCLAVAALFALVNFFKDFGQASRGIGLWLSLLASLGGTASMFLVLKGAGLLPKPDTAETETESGDDDPS